MKFRYLWNACQSNFLDNVRRILKEHPKEFDLAEDDGICFFYALKHNNVEMLNSLLNYYDQKELKGDYFSDRKAQMKLVKILKDNSDHPLVKLSPEIKEIIKSYESKAMAVEDDDGTIIPDFYDEDDSGEARESGSSEHHSDDTFPLLRENVTLLGDCSAGDSDSSEEGL